MKKILLILFLLLKTTCFFSQEYLNQDWITCNNWFIHAPYILNFEKDSIIIATTVEPNGRKHSYQLKNDSLIIDSNKYFAKISYLGKDSLVMKIDDNFWDTKFEKLKFTNVDEDINFVTSILYNSSWYFKTNSGSCIFDFDKIYWRDCRFESNSYWTKSFNSGNYNGKWLVTKYYGNIFLNLGFSDSFDFNTTRGYDVYQIVNIKNDTLNLISYDQYKSEELIFVKSHDISDDSIQVTKSILTSKLWNLDKYEKTSSWGNSDKYTKSSFDMNFNEYYYNPDTVSFNNLHYSKPIDEKYYIKNRISLLFKRDSIFELYVNNKLFTQSKWELSRDGKSIFIQYNGYFKINTIAKDELVIERYIDFKGRRKREFYRAYNTESYK